MPTLIAQYRYDALDRLTTANALRRFYCDKRVASEIEGDITRCFFGHPAQPLALREDPLVNSLLFATDQQASVLHNVPPEGREPQTYSPYGYHPLRNGLLNALGFNGERPESVTGHYLLGQGYRAYNPVLMRFNSPDSLSPMGAGGINAYAYCMGDPINHVDPSGHIPKSIKWLLRKAGIMKPSVRRKNSLYENGIPKPTDDPKGIKEILSGQKRKWGRLYPGYSKEQARLADEYHFLNKYMDLIAQRVKKYPDYKVDLDFQLRDNNKKKKLEEDFSKLLTPNHDLTKPAAKASEIRTAR